jgi:hypothetical protein
VEPLNDRYLREIPKDRFVVCAWGVNANHFPERVNAVEQMIGIKLLFHLGMTGGQPRHPLSGRHGARLTRCKDFEYGKGEKQQ